MAPTVTSGAVDTNTVLAAEKVVDMDNEIKELEVNTTQFTTALMKYPSREATRERIDWLEDQLLPRTTALAATAASSDTTITVTTGDSAVVNVNDMLRNQKTGEMMLVTAVTADTFSVTRAIGGVAAASSVSGAQSQLLIVGNAFQEGADTSASKVTQRVNAYNYTQIVRNSLSFTNTQAAIELYGGRYKVKEQAKKLVEHKRAIEYILFWGARSTTASGTHPLHTAGGAVEYISTNKHDQNGATLSASTLDQNLIADLQFCKDPLIFCAPTVAYNFSQFAATNYRTNSTGEQAYGIKINAFISGAYGDNIPIVVKRDWQDFTVPSSGSPAGYGGWFFLIDMSRVALRPLRDRSTKLLLDRQVPSQDIQTMEYLTEFSLQFDTEKAHSYTKGISKS